MKSRLAVWPLVVAGLFAIAAVASIFLLPTLDPATAVAGISIANNKEIALSLKSFT